jgi:hypothetical protein
MLRCFREISVSYPNQTGISYTQGLWRGANTTHQFMETLRSPRDVENLEGVRSHWRNLVPSVIPLEARLGTKGN